MVQLAQPHSECSISRRGEYIRADVGPGRPSEILECYRSLVTLALEQKFKLALVVGAAYDDAAHHLAARDAVIAFHEIGVPAGFKLALVPLTYPTLNGYRQAEIEAQKRGIRAKVFMEEMEAIRWLTEPDKH